MDIRLQITLVSCGAFALLLLAIVTIKLLDGISRVPEAESKLFGAAIISISMLEFMALMLIGFGVFLK